MQAEQYSKCDLEDVARQLRSGHNVTVLLDYESPYSPTAGVHYVNVIGVDRDESGKISKVHISNPWGGSNAFEAIDADDFMRQWSNVKAARNSVGSIEDVLLALPVSERTMIVTDSKDGKELEAPNFMNNLGQANVNAVLGGVNGMAAGVNAMKTGAIGAGLGQITGSVINTVVGGANYIVGNLIGKNMQEGGDKLIEIGTKMLEGNWLSRVGGHLARFFGNVSKAIGWVLTTLTNLSSTLLLKLTDFLTAPGEKHNARESIRAALMEHENDAAIYMSKASFETKCELAKLLLNDGKNSVDDQKAAIEVLIAAREAGELEQLAQELGGKGRLVSYFKEPQSSDVVSMFAG
jgi:hypothetical protein